MPDDCWALSDGASIFPAVIFERGVRYAECFKFGAAYLEFGSRLRWLGYRLRTLRSSYVIHHYAPGNRSFIDKRLDLGSRMFASLCHSLVYQPSSKNRLLCLAEIGRQVTFHHGWQCFTPGRTGIPGSSEGGSSHRMSFPYEAEEVLWLLQTSGIS
jgi:hypothetical protein